MARHYYKFGFAIVAAAACGLWAGHSLDNHENKSLIETSQQHASSSANNMDNAALVARLQLQVQQLQNENRLLRQQLKSDTPATAKQAATNDVPATNQQLQSKLDSLEMEKQVRRANDFGKWIMESQKSSAAFDLNSELQSRFEQETRDPVWAEQQETHYRQLFSTKEELAGFAFQSTQCRSNQCEVTVSITDAEQAHQLLQTMSKTLQNSTILIATDDLRGTSKLYISSNEKGFEFN